MEEGGMNETFEKSPKIPNEHTTEFCGYILGAHPSIQQLLFLCGFYLTVFKLRSSGVRVSVKGSIR